MPTRRTAAFLRGTFADYLLPTVMEMPAPIILHHETLSPFTPLGAKGVGEGNCMSTPVCIANAVADALGLSEVTLPLLASRLAEHLFPTRARAGAGQAAAAGETGRADIVRRGGGDCRCDTGTDMGDAAGPGGAGVPGARRAPVEKHAETGFRAEVTLGIGPVKGTYRAAIDLSDLAAPESMTLTGSAEGALGFGRGTGHVTLTEQAPGHTRIAYRYEAAIGGKVASIGGRLLDGAARVIIGRFFEALGAHASGRRVGIDGLWAGGPRGGMRGRLARSLAACVSAAAG